ncbi:hypothetical protein LZ198_29450 [Myxococcus sp. K15C18031901]|uniref:hypothetical protein n=1 Tax=Myxococcus dinghuensis TaxID=2906761 RepID=UPI0020A758CC|nr:hypothetical protein [Myxococcus dinghuensis]MCP3103013.1 hypothetical protein [Myxococcus dinghuensis]
MPNVSLDKPTQQTKAPQDTESLTATLVNQTSGDLVLVNSSTDEQWSIPPPSVIASGQSGQFSSPGDFSNPSAGSVTYKAVAVNDTTFTLQWTIPSVGPNNINWQTSPGLTAKESGSLSGWNLSASWFISAG